MVDLDTVALDDVTIEIDVGGLVEKSLFAIGLFHVAYSELLLLFVPTCYHHSEGLSFSFSGKLAAGSVSISIKTFHFSLINIEDLHLH